MIVQPECYYFMRMLFVRDFSKCLSAVYHLLERDSRKQSLAEFLVGCNPLSILEGRLAIQGRF